VFSYLKNKDAVSTLFRDVAPKVSNRNGGYTRIIRTGFRLGDNAEMCMIELVDFNELLLTSAAPKKTTRRSRKAAPKAETTESAVEETTTESTETPEAPEASTEESTEE
jgi:large subunit ribosomal protein L17